MPLPLPDLDTRRWTDLVQEGQALIPRYAPAWTDHNVHDPGITLIELFAWLTEQDIYRVNRVPDRHRRKFLALVGFAPRPPRPALTTLAFDPDVDTTAFPLSAGFEFEGQDPEKHPVVFRTMRDLTVGVVKLAAIQVEEPDADGKLTIVDRTEHWRERLPIAVLGRNPQPGAALYLGFNELPNSVPVALAWQFEGPGSDEDERGRIVNEAAEQRMACRPVLPAIVCETESGQPAQTALERLPSHHSAELAWEVSTGPGNWTRLDPVSGTERPPVGRVMDDTRALTLNGIVEANLPASMTKTTVGALTDLFFLRCRLVSGAYDAPPMLIEVAPNGVVAEQTSPAWQTFTIAAGVVPTGAPPSFPSPAPEFPAIATTRLVMALDEAGVIKNLTFGGGALNQPDVSVLNYTPPSATVSGQLTLELVLAGFGTAAPGQRLVLQERPIHVESLRLHTHSNDVWQEWTCRPDLDGSRRTDFHFVLDAMSGELVFGDGEHGRVVPKGAAVLVVYRATRGLSGNIPAGRVSHPADSPHNAALLAQWELQLVSQLQDQDEVVQVLEQTASQLSKKTRQPLPARHGANSEELAHAVGRAIETLHAHQRLLDVCAERHHRSLDQLDWLDVRSLPVPTRAVNLLDTERLALDVPGTRVARAKAWANVHPAYPCLQAPGVVTVVVIPDIAVPRPEPSQGLIEIIKRYLERRRVVGTRLEVVGPHYLDVSVIAGVRARPLADAASVKARIEEALNAFLDPRRGGPVGMGWPFGRDVYRSEILQVIDDVPGVDHVMHLSLRGGSSESQCGNLSLCPTWLVAPLVYQIEVHRASDGDQRPGDSGLPHVCSRADASHLVQP